MAKKLSTGGLISPTNLWGKPLPTTKPVADKPAKEKVTGKMTNDDDVMDDDEIDVDAELAEADVETDEVEDIEAEDDSEVTDDADDGDEDEEEAEDAEDEEPDYEDDDVEDASQGVVEDAEEVVTAVADDDDDDNGSEETVSDTTEDFAAMAEKMSLSDHVRAEIARRHKVGESLRGKDIVASLEKRKISVSPAQVSQLLKKAGLGGKSRGRPAAAPATAATPSEKSRSAMKAKKRVETPTKTAPPAQPRQALKARPTAGNGFKVPMPQLQAAEAFVEACGGSFQAAGRILTAAEQLSQTFGG